MSYEKLRADKSIEPTTGRGGAGLSPYSTPARAQDPIEEPVRWWLRAATVSLTAVIVVLLGCSSHDEDAQWVHSEPLDVISVSSEYYLEADDRVVVDGFEETFFNAYQDGQVAMDGVVARIDRETWQSLERKGQARFILQAAVTSSGSVDPREWEAEIRDASTGELLAATSANGLRGLWTAAGFLPERPPHDSPVDTESPMTREEKLAALNQLLEVNRGMMTNHYRLSGEVAAIQDQKDGPFPEAKAVLIQGWAAPHRGSTIERPIPSHLTSSSRGVFLVYLPNTFSSGVGSRYDDVHLFLTVLELDGTEIPTFLPGLSREELQRCGELVALIEREMAAVREQREVTSPSGDLSKPTENYDQDETPKGMENKPPEVRIRLAETKLGPLRDQLKTLRRQTVSFRITGEILDREVNSVTVFGVAYPSNNDTSHLGTLMRRGNISVRDLDRIDGYGVFQIDGAYFVGKTTATNAYGAPVPLRVYSTIRPPEVAAVEDEIEGLHNRMSPWIQLIDAAKEEIDAINEERLKNEWESVADSVPQLVAYAAKYENSGDTARAESACARIEELNPNQADPFVACGLMSERLGAEERALVRYEAALSRQPAHRLAGLRRALLMSRQQQDPFDEAKFLSDFLRIGNEADADYANANSRFQFLKHGWGREGRLARLDLDSARIARIQWVTMNKSTQRESVSRNLARCDAEMTDAEGRLSVLNRQLAVLGLDVYTLMVDSRGDSEYWGARGRQATSLRSQIKNTENRLKHEWEQPKITAQRERVRQYSQILREIESEAAQVGISLVDGWQPERAGNLETFAGEEPARKDPEERSRIGYVPSAPVPNESLPPQDSTGEKGHTYFAAGGSASSEVPSWVPIYGNGRFQNPSAMSMGDAIFGGFEVQTDDALDQVRNDYQRELEGNGFEVSTGSSGSLRARSNTKNRKIDVEFDETRTGTLIKVSFSQGR